MSDERRLSEMIGLQPRRPTAELAPSAKDAGWDDALSDSVLGDDDRSTPMWLINGVLLLLGGAILGVAFSFLDPAEPQLLRNPWTYAVATPVMLLLLSLLLNSWVSRMIEKSMQLAFMLSILIHLFLMVYAVNIVIMSRMWPDMMESFASQREQLKRESLQARQYFQPSTSKQTGQRPDYLRLVPTEHQPTEIEKAESPAVQLARAERSDLMTPSPRNTPTLTPHMLERESPVTSTPTASDSAQSLSRSELSRPEASKSSPASREPADRQPLDMLQPEPELAATRTEARRRDESARGAAQAQLPAVALEQPPSLSQPTLERSQAAMTEPRSSSQLPMDLSRNVQSSGAPAGRSRPTAPAFEKSDAATDSLASASAPNRRSAQMAAPLMRVLPDLSQPERSTTVPSSALPQRSDLASISPTAVRSDGQARDVIPRSIAGGAPGAAAPSSMPVQGVESLSTPNNSNANSLQASSNSTARRNRTSSATTSSPSEAGLPQAPTWTGSASMTSGIDGRSAGQLAMEAEGAAVAADNAGLTGAGEAIERSQIGSMSPAGSSAPSLGQVAANGMQEEAGASALEQGSGLESSGTSVRRNGRRRSDSSDSASNSLTSSLNMTPDALGSGNERNEIGSASGILENGANPGRVEAGSEMPSATNGAIAGIERASAGDSAPAGASVRALSEEVAGETTGELAASPQAPEVTSLGMQRNRGDKTSMTPSAVEVDIDAIAGRGGISNLAELTGPVLPRRSDRDLADAFREQFDSQRFSRQDVGGPLAAGRDVALPMPAFQQRLERLQDRDPQDETQIEPKTEQAIERGLAFLARYQRADGSWRLQDFDTPVLMRSDTAATGLALLAFQGAGYTHKQSKYADQVGRALKFLAEHQTADGDLYIPQDPASDQNAWLYSHAIAALAVCEAYGMTQDPELKPMAQRAIDFMVSSQDAKHGGWRYRPGNGTDTSVTGWFMMAFKSGQLAGLQVPAETFRRINGYLDASQVSPQQRHLYRYNPFASDTPQQRHGLEHTSVMTSVGLLMRLYFGWQRDRAEMVAGADHLLKNYPQNGSRSASLRDTYYWYYATQVIFHMGGEHWQKWHDELYPLLIDSQVVQGENEGSWDPYRPTPDLWARYGGRLYVTTMNLLSLEVSYRHLPLYEATAQ